MHVSSVKIQPFRFDKNHIFCIGGPNCFAALNVGCQRAFKGLYVDVSPSKQEGHWGTGSEGLPKHQV